MNENQDLSVQNAEQPVTTVEEPLQPAAPVEQVAQTEPVTPVAPIEPAAPVTAEPVAPVVPVDPVVSEPTIEPEQPVVPEQPVTQEQPTSPAPTEVQPTIQPVGEPVVNTNKKSKLPIIIIVSLLLIGAGVLVYFLFFFKVSGKQVVNGTINKLFATAEKISEEIDEAFIIDYKKDIIKTEGYLKASVESDSPELAAQLNGIKNTSLKYNLQLNAKDLEAYLNASFNENDEEILNISGLLTDKILYFKSNAFESTYKVDLTNQVDWNEVKEAINNLPEYNSKFVSEFVKKMKGYITDSIKEEWIEQEDGTYTVDNTEIKGLKTTITLTQKRYYEMLKSILTSAKNDKDFVELLSKTTTIPQETIIQGLEEGIKAYEEVTIYDEDSKLYINIYTTAKGSFQGLEVKVQESVVFTAVSKDDITTIKLMTNKPIVLIYDEKKKELSWTNDDKEALLSKIVVTFKDKGFKAEIYVSNMKITLEDDYVNSSTQLNEKLVASLETTTEEGKSSASLELVCLLEKANSIEKFDTANAKDFTAEEQAIAQQGLGMALQKSKTKQIYSKSMTQVDQTNIHYIYSY